MEGGQVIVHSAVRLPSPQSREPTPPPAISSKRKRTSRSPTSPPRDNERRRSPPHRRMRNDFGLPDVDPERAAERIRQLEARSAMKDEPAKPAFDPKAEYEKLLTMRSGGTYIPPARLRALQSQITDKTSKEYQRMAWEQLKKSINGLINKVNTSNIKSIVPDLFQENLIRGRGLYCRSIMKAQAAALTYTPVYAAMTAIINTKLPQVGELLVKRLVIQFRKAFKRNDKAVCLSSTTFIAHLVNQQVAHEVLALEILMLLLMQNATDDSVEIAVGFMREVGAYLAEMSTKANEAIYDAFRNILHESSIDKRVQYMIEVLFQVRRDKYKDNPIVREELDLVEEEDQITHQINISDDSIESQDTLNVFKFDPHYEEHENLYKRTRAEILGEESGSEGEDGSDEEDEEESDEEQDEKEKQLLIQDQSNTNLVNLRRTIYLTIMSSIDFEECCHKLMKITLPPGQEPELVSMIVECCSQERTYAKFYGNIGERFCKLNRLWQDLFEKSFTNYYETIHRYEINRLRNIARFFGHQLANDAIGWQSLNIIHLNEEETTSSSRIFIKILFQDLAEQMTMKKVVERLNDPFLAESFAGLFPRDNPRNTRFAINYFTSIGMGAVTEGLREFLQSMPKQTVPALPVPRQDSDDESDRGRSKSRSSSYTRSSYSRSRSARSARSYSYSRSRSRSRSYDSRSPGRGRNTKRRSYSKSSRSYSSRSRSYSSSRSRSRSRSKEAKKNSKPGRDDGDRKGRGRDRSYDSYSSRSRSRSRSHSKSRSPPKRANRRASPSRSRSPPPARGKDNYRRRSPSYDDRSPPKRGGARDRSPEPSRRARDHSRQRSFSPRRDRGSMDVDRQESARDSGRGGGGGRAKASDFL
ncbi:pre-mRNA-splicing factor cwc22 [Orbilia oligospora]|uniref:Pre-mRNA-splicing factor CWC22 n=1 Tax=Orbilia oligospora TaxID=2813651 RepID=A0A7C8U8A1_ORBOL|nr:pre-mRNA-splicing factor cwc22 [Orbilia oligospora]KAF3215173.1 pre-mRNA-splicing factor cwc22 [Orbilia oligospora]